MLRVAMITRSTLYSARGGDTVQVFQTAGDLPAYGAQADIFLTHETVEYDKYDLLHFFNITRPADILHHIKKSRKPFVVSTILVDYSEYDKHHRKGIAGMVFRYLSPGNIEYLKALMRRLLGNDRLMSLSYLWKGHKSSITAILRQASMVLPNSISEHERLKKLYNCQAAHAVIPNGIDPHLFSFDKEVEKDPCLVLCVGRIEGIKNQLNLIRALNNSKYHLVIIGTPAKNQRSYYAACLNIAAPNVSFVAQLPQKELVKYYQKAAVHVLPSWFETTGLSSLEAAVMGCGIVISDRGDAKEYFGPFAAYCKPDCPQSIYEAVEMAASANHQEELRSRIIKYYTWQQATLLTAEAYKAIINKHEHENRNFRHQGHTQSLRRL